MGIADLEYRDLPFKGGYVLLLRLDERSKIRVGRLGEIEFDSGYYAYVGSAMGGLKQRIQRHLRSEKIFHWHIDYLLEKTSLENIIVCQSKENIECRIASEVRKIYKVINRFGSTDCKCPGHLFYDSLGISNNVKHKLDLAGLKPQLVLDEKDNSN